MICNMYFLILWVVPAVISCTHILLRKIWQSELPREADLKRNSREKHVAILVILKQHFLRHLWELGREGFFPSRLPVSPIAGKDPHRCCGDSRRQSQRPSLETSLSDLHCIQWAQTTSLSHSCQLSNFKIQNGVPSGFTIKVVSQCLPGIFLKSALWGPALLSVWCSMEKCLPGQTIALVLPLSVALLWRNSGSGNQQQCIQWRRGEFSSHSAKRSPLFSTDPYWTLCLDLRTSNLSSFKCSRQQWGSQDPAEQAASRLQNSSRERIFEVSKASHLWVISMQSLRAKGANPWPLQNSHLSQPFEE